MLLTITSGDYGLVKQNDALRQNQSANATNSCSRLVRAGFTFYNVMQYFWTHSHWIHIHMHSMSRSSCSNICFIESKFKIFKIFKLWLGKIKWFCPIFILLCFTRCTAIVFCTKDNTRKEKMAQKVPFAEAHTSLRVLFQGYQIRLNKTRQRKVVEYPFSIERYMGFLFWPMFIVFSLSFTLDILYSNWESYICTFKHTHTRP